MLLPTLVPFQCVDLLDGLLDPYPRTRRIIHFNNVSLKYTGSSSRGVRQWLGFLINLLLLQQVKRTLGEWKRMKPQVKRSICVSGTIYSSTQGATLLTLKMNQILLMELIVFSASTSAKYASKLLVLNCS